MKDNYEQVKRESPIPIRKITAGGGAARTPLSFSFRQIFSRKSSRLLQSMKRVPEAPPIWPALDAASGKIWMKSST
jgi:hypothetical protein